MRKADSILITGASGYIGHQVGNALVKNTSVIGCDIRPNASADFDIVMMDINDQALEQLMLDHRVTHVIHLASVLEASDDRARDYRIDVDGTRNVLESCLKAGVSHVTIASSGAAYGYHADNAEWLNEQDPIRGNYEFAYAWHKRLVEEMLEDYRKKHPELHQLVLRPGTVLGADTRNLITNLFLKKRILTLKGSDSPFVFIWDQDVVNIICQGVENSQTGIFNLAGDGAMSLKQIAQRLKKPTLQLNPGLLKFGLRLGKQFRLTRYGPEQLKFLQYRPVLANDQLKSSFGYRPAKSSEEVFDLFAENVSQGERQ